MDIATLSGHLAFGLIAFSFLVKDILYLRILSILASLFSVFYNFYIPTEPMWLAINWNVVFVLVNVYHIAVLKDLTPVEYLKVSKAAIWKTFQPNEFVTRQTHLVRDLVLIYNGTIDVLVDGKKVAQLKDGQFVGEMSFLTEKSATATCIVKHPCECLVWKQREFKELLKRNPSLYFTLQTLLSAQVSDNLVSSSKSE